MNTDQETKSSKRKPANKSKKPVGFSQEEVDTMLEQAKRDAAREAEERVRTEYEYEDPTQDDDPSLFGQQAAEIPITDEQDFFDHIEENFVSKGVGVSYYIQKDGMFQKEMRHPLSWSKIQSMFGGGHYKVTAKKADNKQYIKSKVMDIAEPDGPRGTENQPQQPVVVQAPAPAPNSLDPNFLMELVAKMSEQNRKDERQAEKEEAKASSSIMTTILTVTQSQAKDTLTMMMEMNKANAEMMRNMQENTAKMIEKMDDKTTKLIEGLKPKESGIDQFKLMDMIQKAEDRGFERMKMIMELAEDKAEELKTDESPKSAIGSLISGIVPLLTTVNTQMQQQPMVQQLPPAQPRRQAPPAIQQQSTTVGQGQQNQVHRPPATIVRPVARPTQSPIQKVVRPTGSPTRPVAKPVIAPKDMTIDELLMKASEKQKQFVEAVLPLIAGPMQAGMNTESAARDVYSKVKSWKHEVLTPEALLVELPFDISRQIAVAFGMGSPAQIQWLKEFYAHFKVTTDAESALSQPNGSNPASGQPSDHRGGEARQPANS